MNLSIYIGLHPSFFTLFQSEIRLIMNFTAELNDSTSRQFKSLARSLEDSLLPALKQKISSVSKVVVKSFRSGSVITNYDIIMDNTGGSVSLSQLNIAVGSVVASGLPGLPVDTTYSSTVAG